ncbi:MAG: hypothetical protein Q7T80_18200 [Methanoregula sp.]|nr:hypothetical protein [Methanoregula sp.]
MSPEERAEAHHSLTKDSNSCCRDHSIVFSSPSWIVQRGEYPMDFIVSVMSAGEFRTSNGGKSGRRRSEPGNNEKEFSSILHCADPDAAGTKGVLAPVCDTD